MTTTTQPTTESAAIEACKVLGLCPMANCEAVRDLQHDLSPYTTSVRLVVRRAGDPCPYGAAHRVLQDYVEMYAADDGCVNEGSKLAEAWVDCNGSFYWES